MKMLEWKEIPNGPYGVSNPALGFTAKIEGSELVKEVLVRETRAHDGFESEYSTKSRGIERGGEPWGDDSWPIGGGHKTLAAAQQATEDWLRAEVRVLSTALATPGRPEPEDATQDPCAACDKETATMCPCFELVEWKARLNKTEKREKKDE